MIICIVGPSSIGKTKLSISLAKKYNAIIINADATQVYKYLDIGSAKITEEEKDNIKHYMIDIKNPDETYSVYDYQKDARKILEENINRNIIVVGGTGLYLNALFKDYEFSEYNTNNYDELSDDELYNLALKKDSNLNIHKNNRVRLINLLNKKEIKPQSSKDLYDVIYIGLTSDREIIYERVNKRVDDMIKLGLEKEVRNLYQQYPDSDILKRAIGYKEIINYIKGEIDFDEAIDLIKKNTRHYVKRQYTWFNNKMKINWFNVDFNNFNNTIYEICSFIESLNSR